MHYVSLFGGLILTAYGMMWLGDWFARRLWSKHTRIRQAGYALARTRDELHGMLAVLEIGDDAPPFRHYVEDEAFVWFVHHEHHDVLDELALKYPTNQDMHLNPDVITGYAEALIVFFDERGATHDPHADIFDGAV